jgi:predicted AlkP superfamily phosphohydrolase/phosphomutase
VYIGHKVTIKAKTNYSTNEEQPEMQGIVVDVSRDAYGNMNCLYVMVIDKVDGRGYVYMSPLHELVFQNGNKLLEDIKNPYEKVINQTLGMMLQSARPLEV